MQDVTKNTCRITFSYSYKNVLARSTVRSSCAKLALNFKKNILFESLKGFDFYLKSFTIYFKIYVQLNNIIKDNEDA